jgi:uncharacterized RDD family membrane protein YckC
MSTTGIPASWYPDPSGNGGLRYWDGAAWTPHVAPPPPPAVAWGLSWKGAQLGRPQAGPGALTDPGRRLCARLLDILVLIPVFALVLTITLLIAAPHFGPIFPTVYANGTNVNTPTPGFLWIYVTILGCGLGTGMIMIAYETVATARYGRTLGKAWMHIRPLRRDGTTISTGRAFGRVAIYWLFGFLSWIGLLDPLFCTWDDQRQCLHDKVADTIVVNDPV